MNSSEAQSVVNQGIQQMLEDPDQWRQWATTMAKFHHYSPGNVLLIMSQKPDATRVAGYHAWQDLGRHVQRGEHGITILAPVMRRREEEAATAEPEKPAPPALVGFRAATVFDVSQTAGRDLPVPEPKLLDGAALAELFGSLTAVVGAPILMAESNTMGGANGVWSPANQTITVAADRAPDQQVKTLLHEWAHAVGVPDVAAAVDRHRGAEEITAETTAYVLAQRLGMDTSQYSIPYVGHWAAGDPAKVLALTQAVSQRVQTMSTTLEQAAQHDPALARALGMPEPQQAEADYEMEA
ncbi:ArdC-like ssDNA-binding domain-containing protein [Sulfobacillus harzensis]|uniref:N-terminal domain-containing protein n=1 Tax=Sulfobacillus harzensis TaxID=2729629 RepID=A0A7Y0L7F8_9FIRM|nr:ArdC-like ssDNA-binding domain-containing protein [Sulfobacillus harzensis]NMP24352.1 hypothetical protein [Sulfobacillus harzensis]